MEAASIFIVLFAGIFGVLYYYLLSRHKERILLIEKGADAKLFKTEPRKGSYFFAMLVGVLLICLSLGFVFGTMFERYLIDIEIIGRGSTPLPYFIMIFLMLGTGFIVSFFLHKKMVVDKKD
jgi:hypothetical protein